MKIALNDMNVFMLTVTEDYYRNSRDKAINELRSEIRAKGYVPLGPIRVVALSHETEGGTEWNDVRRLSQKAVKKEVYDKMLRKELPDRGRDSYRVR